MKAMKGLSMNKMLGKLQRRTTGDGAQSSPRVMEAPQVGVDGSPEQVVVSAIRKFCESGGPSSSSGDEVILLPTIVEATESSPGAAIEAARQLRKFMSRDYNHKPSRQYNAIMIFRILVDNPGPAFTKNIDKKFIDATKELLRTARDPSVLTLTWETLDNFERTKTDDEGLKPLLEMWKKEKERSGMAQGHHPPQGGHNPNMPLADRTQGSQNYWARHHTNKRLPGAVELASRLEEARTSAKLLQQAVACTPPQEVLSNELIREFANRCQSASGSIQSYMVASSPAPDNDTMEHLIDTNEQLQSSLNQHQRAVLGARKAMGIGEADQNSSPNPSNHRPRNTRDTRGTRETNKPLPSVGGSGAGLGIDFSPISNISSHSTPPPVPGREGNGKGKGSMPPPPPPRAGPSGSNTPAPQEDDPFKDPEEKLGFESYHPGFGSGTNNNNGKQPAKYDQEEDDGFYDNSPLPKKDPGETMLRY